MLNRRTFLKQTLALASGTLFVTGGYNWLVELGWLTVERVQVPLKTLPAALEGFKIVQLSDFHLYPYTRLNHIEEAVRVANNLQPDLIALTGDFIWFQQDAIFDLAPALANLNAKYGIFSVLGNHDHHDDAHVVRQALNKAGLQVLHNQGVTLQVGNGALHVAGVDDPLFGQPDFGAVLGHLPTDIPSVFLLHEPDYIDSYVDHVPVSLQLSGHTHGGQIRLPGLGPLALPPMGQKYDKGLFQVNDSWLYVNRGLGASVVPVRMNCRPEITELTLVRA